MLTTWQAIIICILLVFCLPYMFYLKIALSNSRRERFNQRTYYENMMLNTLQRTRGQFLNAQLSLPPGKRELCAECPLPYLIISSLPLLPENSEQSRAIVELINHGQYVVSESRDGICPLGHKVTKDFERGQPCGMSICTPETKEHCRQVWSSLQDTKETTIEKLMEGLEK